MQLPKIPDLALMDVESALFARIAARAHRRRVIRRQLRAGLRCLAAVAVVVIILVAR